ncbi:MAG: tRNA uridine-5-carboxymethylaminomethyl(34) synthesis GTPase MnmE [Magnetococcales bacterium]|nr:tRNA uridine-5-carboxymethylaminomethyl(34) synthesis GTPase MnmE [Magnetococcales bacterium]
MGLLSVFQVPELMRSPLSTDPIAALATPPGRSGVAIIRISGESIWQKIAPLLRRPNGHSPGPETPTPRLLQRLDFLEANRQCLDQALVVYFAGPNSFTGEDLVEIQGHGSPVVTARIMERLTEVGIRPADPGEFSRRAFLNGKTDLAQAEALMTLINASSLRAAREAVRQMEGALSARLLANRSRLLEALAHLEATLDFADEDISPDDQKAIVSRLIASSEDLGKLVRGAMLGRQLAEGFQLAIVGRPNVGKSSLFNLLLGQNRAIVTAQPGTTRDLLESSLEIQGIPVQLTDTAGLRQTDEIIEQEGIRRAKERLQEADAVLFLLDAGAGILPEDRDIAGLIPAERTLVLWNKTDLLGEAPVGDLQALALPETVTTHAISCKSGEGLAELLEKIAGYFASLPIDGEGSVVMVARQRQALQKSLSHLARAEAVLVHGQNEELVAISIREALHELGELVGQSSHDDLLDVIFSSFCIGK